MLLMVALLFGCVPGATESPTVSATPRPLLTITPRSDAGVIPRPNRPNILLILLDDLDVELGSTGYMPILQNLLVDQGLTLEDFYVSSSVCCPSRATILRGQYSHNHGVLSNNAPFGGFEKFYYRENESSTLATWLQAAGYETVLLGKYLNGYPFREDRDYVPVGWTEWYSPAKGKPYVGFNYTLNQNGVQVDYRDMGQGPSLYITDVLSDKAVDFIQRSAGDPSPFFMFLSLYAPHQPATPAARHADLFPDLIAPRTPSFNEQDVSDKTGVLQFNTPLTAEQIADLDGLYRRRVQTLQAADEAIGRLIQTLEETGELENTYIIFTSDNGFHLGQHRLYAGKATLYEEDIHVPFVIRGPGITAGDSLSGYLAGNVDLAPTIAELAGVIPPEFVDGRSLVGLFGDQKPALADWRSGYFLEVYGQEGGEEEGESTQPLASLKSEFGLRTADYLYAEYEDGSVELYDMRNDPYQLQNIAGDADQALLDQLSGLLHALQECSGSACRTLEETVVKE
jgi:arylsulfatase A-like enzyme